MIGDADGTVHVVQFPHPGPEHRPGPSEVMPWNTGPHARKFLHSPGRWLAHDDTLGEGDIAF